MLSVSYNNNQLNYKWCTKIADRTAWQGIYAKAIADSHKQM